MLRRVADLYRRAYSGLPREAWVLAAVTFVNSSGSMVLFFLTLYLTRRLGFTAAQAGRALSVYGVGMLAGAWLGGWLSDRIGSIRVQKISLFASGVLLIGLGQVGAAAALVPLLFVLGVVTGALYPANSASMAHTVRPELQVKGFALLRLGANLGVTIGPAVGGLLALRDYRLLFWADGLTCLAALAVLALAWKSPAEARSRTAHASSSPASPAAAAPRPASPFRDRPFLLLMGILLVWAVVFNQLFSTYPLYMRNVYRLTEDVIGRLLAVNTILIVTLEMALMEAIRRVSRTRLINVSFLLLGLGLGLMPFGRGAAYAAFTVAVWTFGEILSMPLLSALIAGRGTPETRGRYMGMFSFAFSLSFIVAPALGTAVYGRFGGNALWLGCAGVTVVLAVAFSFLRPSLRAGDVDDRVGGAEAGGPEGAV